MVETKFELVFSGKYCSEGDLLRTSDDGCLFVVDSDVKEYYNKWYFKLLHFITFKKLFRYRAVYTIKKV